MSNTPPLHLLLNPRDPLIFRDARPFAFGQRMKGLPWLTPGLVAGSVRSSLGKSAAQGEFSPELRQALQDLHISTAYPCHERQLYLPAPQDAVATREERQINVQQLHISTLDGGEGIYPYACASGHFLEHSSGKRVELPAWWRFDKLAQWLANQLDPQEICRDTDLQKGYWRGPTSDTRTHVGMGCSGVAEDGQLFQTQGMDLHPMQLAVRMHWDALKDSSGPHDPKVQALHNALQQADTWPRFVPLGGEHRPVQAKTVDAFAGWDCPQVLSAALAGTSTAQAPRYVRMILTSPAYFTHGWRPSWIDEKGEGHPPSAPKVKLKLLAATVSRWQAVSGWSYAHKAPKRTHRVVPAGAVYFFEVCEGNPADLAPAWMKHVGDMPSITVEESTFTDSLHGSGYGLAVWGPYQPTSALQPS